MYYHFIVSKGLEIEHPYCVTVMTLRNKREKPQWWGNGLLIGHCGPSKALGNGTVQNDIYNIAIYLVS